MACRSAACGACNAAEDLIDDCEACDSTGVEYFAVCDFCGDETTSAEEEAREYAECPSCAEYHDAREAQDYLDHARDHAGD